MTAPVRFREAAEADVDDAVACYAAKTPEPSLQFLEAVSEVVDRIARGPLTFPMRVGRARRANLERPWPFALWYVADPDGSVVIAALHDRQDMTAIRKRLEP